MCLDEVQPTTTGPSLVRRPKTKRQRLSEVPLGREFTSAAAAAASLRLERRSQRRRRRSVYLRPHLAARRLLVSTSPPLGASGFWFRVRPCEHAAASGFFFFLLINQLSPCRIAGGSLISSPPIFRRRRRSSAGGTRVLFRSLLTGAAPTYSPSLSFFLFSFSKLAVWH